VKKLAVYLSDFNASCSPETPPRRLVGTLAEHEHRIYFEYDRLFLEDPLWLSPFKLPPQPGLHEHRDLSFGPLFGLFDDSLPDGWGLLLMDRYFRQRGTLPETLSPLDRLAYLGTRTMGALTYHPPTTERSSSQNKLDLHTMAHEAGQVLAGKVEAILPQLLQAGGSPGGARPKVLIGIKGDHIISGEEQLPEGYQAWIVKFPAREDDQDAGRMEYAYSGMARAAGITMPATRLFTTPQGDAFFGVQRFDRDGGIRHHVHTFGNLIHANFRIPSCDYEMLLRVTRALTKNHDDNIAAFRIMVFNILAHNRDDHVKNIAFIMPPNGEWRLAPAYDVTFAPGPGGEHAMTVAGEGRSPTLKHILQVAERAGISNATAKCIVDDVANVTREWPYFAHHASLPSRQTETLQRKLHTLRNSVLG